MKLIVMFLFVSYSFSSFACQQGPAAAYDLRNINDALNSEAFADEIQKHYAQNFEVGIKAIDQKDGKCE